METIEIREEENETLTSWANDLNLEIWEILRRIIEQYKKAGFKPHNY